MKASQIVGPRKVEIVEVAEPSIDSVRNVKIEVELSCLCGSDIPFFNIDLTGMQNLAPEARALESQVLEFDREEMYPLKPGLSLHECVGTVVESSSDRIREGQFVLAKPDLQIGYLEYFSVSHDQVLPLPRNSVEKGEILMAQPLGTVISACKKIGSVIGKDTVVIGSGPMGLLLMHMFANLGARTVIALDRLDYRLKTATRMRASHTVNVDSCKAREAIEEITSGKMADLVVEAVGHQTETMRDAVSFVRDNGTILGFGAPDSVLFDGFPYFEIFRRNIRLVTSVITEPLLAYSLARDLIVQGRVDVSPLLTHRFAFDDSQEAYETFSDRRDGVIKALINFEH